MTDLLSGVYDLQKFHFIFHFSDSEREKERNTLREGRREHQSRGRAICDLRYAMRGKRRRRRRARASCGVAATWSWWVIGFGLLGFGFGLCIEDFFFFFRKTPLSLCVWFAVACWVWFALVDLLCIGNIGHWGLVSLPLIWFLCHRRDGFDFLILCNFLFFFGWESVGLPWASYWAHRGLSLPWASLLIFFFCLKLEHIIFFNFIFY